MVSRILQYLIFKNTMEIKRENREERKKKEALRKHREAERKAAIEKKEALNGSEFII